MTGFDFGPRSELTVTFEFARDATLAPADVSRVEIYLAQYAQDLCDDLAIPALPTVRISTAAPDVDVPQPAGFRLTVGGTVSRTRWFPAPADNATVRDLAQAMAEALHDNRALLLTPAFAHRVALHWHVANADGYAGGWSAEGFAEFLSLAVRRHLNICRLEACIASTPGARTRSEATLRFEAALEALCYTSDGSLGFGLCLHAGTSLSDADLAACETRLRAFARERGVVLPEPMAFKVIPSLGAWNFRFVLNDVRLPVIRGLAPDETVVNPSLEAMSELGIQGRAAFEPLNGAMCTIVGKGPAVDERLHANDVEPLEPAGALYIYWYGGFVIKRNAGSLVAAPIVVFLIDAQRKDIPDVVREARARLATFGGDFAETSELRWTVTAVLRVLLDELVSIGDLRAILESVLFVRELSGGGERSRIVYFRTPTDAIVLAEGKHLVELTVADLAACARLEIRALAVEFARPLQDGYIFRAMVLGRDVGQRLYDSAVNPLSDDEVHRFRKAVFDVHFKAFSAYDYSLPLVVAQTLRPIVRELLSLELPFLAVIGDKELPPIGETAWGFIEVTWPSIQTSDPIPDVAEPTLALAVPAEAE